jgi:hypothetical protein
VSTGPDTLRLLEGKRLVSGRLGKALRVSKPGRVQFPGLPLEVK